MDKMRWCLKTKKGIEIVEPNGNLAEAYIKKAEESLGTMRLAKSREWKISTAYYTLYFSLYAILMRIGIKCEIHSCTIEFAKRFLPDYFDKAELMLLEDSLNARIDAQYYVDREVSDNLYEKMIKEAANYIVKCKNIILKLDERKINQIRYNLQNI